MAAHACLFAVCTASEDCCALCPDWAASSLATLRQSAIFNSAVVGGTQTSARNHAGSYMQYVCDAGTATWFRIETPGEAVLESQAMNHAVEKFFRDAYDKAAAGYVPPKSLVAFEQRIGLKAHIHRTMPRLLVLLPKPGTPCACIRGRSRGAGHRDHQPAGGSDLRNTVSSPEYSITRL